MLKPLDDSEKPDQFLELITPLDKKTLKLTRVSGSEYLSRPFHFHLEMISEDDKIDPCLLIGKNVTFSIGIDDESSRPFHGVVSSFARGNVNVHGHRRYSAEVVPWLWFLTRTSDCRIFENQEIRGILKNLFEELGFKENQHFELDRIKCSHPIREYCVQYRETAFNFITRLLEEEGIYYYFRQAADRHVLVLADRVCGYEKCEDKVDFPHVVSETTSPERLTAWSRQHRFRTGRWSQNDFNYCDPNQSLLTAPEATLAPTHDAKDYEFYDYPGLYQVTPDGQRLTRVRMEEEETEHETVGGESTYMGFRPGGTILVNSHLIPEEVGKSYVITSVDHSAEDIGNSRAAGKNTTGYSNRFTCIPSILNFRPRRRAIKPAIQGMQTAFVVTSDNNKKDDLASGGDSPDEKKQDEIDVDELGRVKVRFHWDRRGAATKPLCTRIRVAQFSAGAGWGAHFWPRVGHEVVVAFLEGDPDRPLIVGSVYNGTNRPPYALSEHQTRSGIKTQSTPDGGPDEFNEIRFEDRKGHEQVYIHAERAMRTVVEAGETRSVGASRKTTVGQHDELTVKKHNRKVDIEEGNDLLNILQGFRSTVIAGDDSLTITEGNREAAVEQGNDTLHVPEGTRHVAAKRIEMQATSSITLVVGDSKIQMEPDRMVLSVLGTSIALDSASLRAAASLIESAAKGLHEIVGLPVKINC